MRYLFLVLTFLLFACSEQQIDVTSDSAEDNLDMVSHSDPLIDCGMSPYLLLGDQMFVNEKQTYKCSVRFIKIVNEKEPEVIDMISINKSIDRLNKDFKDLRISFEAAETVVIEDKKAFKEGIRMYQKHGRIWSEPGYINVFIYPSTIGSFSGAAGGIPSQFLAIKEYYLPTGTISHEVGHCFGLYHIHTKDKTGAINSYTSGDLICETPYADFFSKGSSVGYVGRTSDDCKYIGPLGNLTQEQHNTNIVNIMSYSLSECRKEFHKEQVERAHFIINNSEDLKNTLQLKR